MVDDSDTSDLKIVDFGLSKIIGPNETSLDPFGTLSYVAPEVLLQKPYGKEVDYWSLGVITYLLLSRVLPFDDEDDKEEEEGECEVDEDTGECLDMSAEVVRASEIAKDGTMIDGEEVTPAEEVRRMWNSNGQARSPFL